MSDFDKMYQVHHLNLAKYLTFGGLYFNQQVKIASGPYLMTALNVHFMSSGYISNDQKTKQKKTG